MCEAAVTICAGYWEKPDKASSCPVPVGPRQYDGTMLHINNHETSSELQWTSRQRQLKTLNKVLTRQIEIDPGRDQTKVDFTVKAT